MAICKKIRRTLTKVCTGALNKKIQIQIRAITPPAGESVDYSEEFTELITTWAMIDTPTGTEVFDSTNTVKTVTHDFYIRYIPNITFEEWILYDNKYYDILMVEDFQEDKQYYRLRCNLRGDETKPVNWA